MPETPPPNTGYKSVLQPDLAFYNGKIVTADAGFSLAEGVAIYGGRFAAVGPTAEIRALGAAREIDLRGQTVLPGLIDNHTHQLLAGLDSPEAGVKVNIATLQSIEEIVAALRQRAIHRLPHCR